MLTVEQKHQFEEEGYLVFENVLSEEELAALRVASDALQEERMRIGGEERLAVIQDVIYKGDAFMRAARHPFLLAAVADLLGPNLQLQHCKLNWKPPTIGKGEIDWHQDFPFFPHTNYDLLAAMFLLDDAIPENGCMRVIPGSHKLGPLPHHQDGTFVGKLTDLSAIEEREPVDLTVKAGGLTLHHVLSVHSSYPNITDTPRRGLVYQIRAADAVQLGGNFWRSNGWQLQGEDPLVARCIEGAFKLPRHFVNRGGIPCE
ncbi:MAG TPA: phytanoyl-CoA dioxygenase family protein [Chthonomonadales bacterium]|nr:phytanoyl-CoA dioxygenase family protein [Chthonomonadales bacterium]